MEATNRYGDALAAYLVEKKLTTEELGFLAKIDPNELRERKTNYLLLHQKARELQQAGLPIVNLASLFKNTTESVFRDGCCHLNDRGHTLLLEHLAQLTAEKVNRK